MAKVNLGHSQETKIDLALFQEEKENPGFLLVNPGLSQEENGNFGPLLVDLGLFQEAGVAQ